MRKKSKHEVKKEKNEKKWKIAKQLLREKKIMQQNKNEKIEA